METKIINLFGASGTGKCFAKGTRVRMYDGSIKNIEDIKIGDFVMGDDSTARMVLELHQGKAPLYMIERSFSSPIIVSANHILTLKHRVGGIKTYWEEIDIPLEDYMLKTKNYKNFCRIYKKQVNFDNKNNLLVDPYYLGYWLGDGISGQLSRICTADDEVIDYCKGYAKKLGLKFKQHSNKEGKCQTYALSAENFGNHKNHPLSWKLYNLNEKKYIPDVYKTASLKDRLQLIAGLIDSDGSLSKTSYDWINKNKELAFDFYELINSCGLKAVIHPCKKSCGDFIGDYWRINITGDLTKIPVLIERKKCKKTRDNPDLVLQEGFKIHPLGEGEYYGFSTDGNHRFLLGDSTVVHNSTGAAYIFSQLKLNGISCELVPEYAKDKVWEGNEEIFKPENQTYIFGKQFYRISRLIGKVKYIITDSPILLSNVYNKSDILKLHFEDAVRDCHKSLNNINYLIRRAKPFDPNGRNEKSAEESDKYLPKIIGELTTTGSEWDCVLGNEEGYDMIVKDILTMEGVE